MFTEHEGEERDVHGGVFSHVSFPVHLRSREEAREPCVSVVQLFVEGDAYALCRRPESGAAVR